MKPYYITVETVFKNFNVDVRGRYSPPTNLSKAEFKVLSVRHIKTRELVEIDAKEAEKISADCIFKLRDVK